jgi:RND family efflux transporter MFP subunit
MVARPEAVLTRRGSVSAGARLRLGFNAAGVVSFLEARTGDVVKKGQLLAKLKDADATFALQAAEAYHARAQRDYRAADLLVTTGALAVAQRDDAQSALRVAAANESAAAESLGQRQLRAPIEGTVLERLAEPGEAVGPGAPVLVIEDTKRLVVKVGVTEAELSRVQAGQGANVILDGSDAPIRATVTSLAPAPGDDGLYSVEVSPEATPSGNGAKVTFRSGTLVTVRFDDRAATPAVHAPLDALVYRDDKTWVFVVGGADDTRAHLREVAVDRADGKDVLVRAGLADGDRIVREGAQFLEDGQPVRVIE